MKKILENNKIKSLKTICIFSLLVLLLVTYFNVNSKAMSLDYNSIKNIENFSGLNSNDIKDTIINETKSAATNYINNELNSMTNSENLNFFQKIWNTIVNFFKSIKEFFTGSSDDVAKKVTKVVNDQINEHKDVVIDKTIEIAKDSLGGAGAEYLKDLKNKDITISEEATKEAIDLAKGYFNKNDNTQNNKSTKDGANAILDIVSKFAGN